MAEAEKTPETSLNNANNSPGAVVSPGGETSPETPLAQTEPTTTAFTSNTPTEPSDSEGVQWAASEFIAHEKTAGWYTTLIVGALAGAVIMYIITKDKVSAIVVLVAAFFFGVYGARKPRQLDYQLDAHGFRIGQKAYSFQQFRCFAVVPEGAFSSIVFTPLKRFAAYTTIYYDPADEEKIIKLLSNRLPFEEHKADPVDNLMRRLRF